MKIYKWCGADWVRTHQKFCRPGDVVFISGAKDENHFEVVSMPYQTPHNLEYTIDLKPIERWQDK